MIAILGRDSSSRRPLPGRSAIGPYLAAAATDPAISVMFKRSFDEQVAFFRGKLGRLMPTRAWDDLSKAQHDRAFMVAGAAQADLLADLAGAVDKAVTEGETLQQFRARFREIVQRRGWHGWTGEGTTAGEAWRTRVIYETNLSTSYAAGRLAQLKEGEYPFWIYKHSDVSVRPRPQHVAWDGLTLPPDHKFWQQHSPPNGWGCRCRVVGVRSAAQARRLGGDPDKQLPQGWNAIDPKTGAPVGIDEGWDYQPGESVVDTIRALTPKLNQLPSQPSIAVIQDWLASSAFRDWFDNPVGAWPLVRLPKEHAQAIGSDISIASLSSETVAKQKAEHPELTSTEYVAAQRVVDDPTHIVQEGQSQVYIRDESTEESGGYVLVVRATWSGEGLWVTSYRRLSRNQVKRDKEITRLLAKGGKQ